MRSWILWRVSYVSHQCPSRAAKWCSYVTVVTLTTMGVCIPGCSECCGIWKWQFLMLNVLTIWRRSRQRKGWICSTLLLRETKRRRLLSHQHKTIPKSWKPGAAGLLCSSGRQRCQYGGKESLHGTCSAPGANAFLVNHSICLIWFVFSVLTGRTQCYLYCDCRSRTQEAGSQGDGSSGEESLFFWNFLRKRNFEKGIF